MDLLVIYCADDPVKEDRIYACSIVVSLRKAHEISVRTTVGKG
jgi:hypothetical protein